MPSQERSLANAAFRSENGRRSRRKSSLLSINVVVPQVAIAIGSTIYGGRAPTIVVR
jgi:hypothetical protein